MRSRVSSVGTCRALSMSETRLGAKPVLSATSACESPAFSRSLRIRSPMVSLINRAATQRLPAVLPFIVVGLVAHDYLRLHCCNQRTAKLVCALEDAECSRKYP